MRVRKLADEIIYPHGAAQEADLTAGFRRYDRCGV